jgi:hypothetical protein
MDLNPFRSPAGTSEPRAQAFSGAVKTVLLAVSVLAIVVPIVVPAISDALDIPHRPVFEGASTLYISGILGLGLWAWGRKRVI